MAENNENKNDMLEALDSIEQVKVGDVVKGEVLAIDDDRQAIVGIKDAGVEGVVPAKELSTKPVEDINDAVKVGDELDLVVISKIGNDKENGSYLLSHRRLEARKVWDDIQKKFEVLVSSNPALNSLAVDAYKSYIFVSYFYLIYSHICISIESLDCII